jgi:hypothetical protein
MNAPDTRRQQEIAELTKEEQERIRRRDSLPILPETLAQAAAIVGTRWAVLLARKFGGERVRFSAHPRAGNELLALLGERRYALLRDRVFGTDKIEVPLARGYLAMLDARALRQRGRSYREIANALRITTSMVQRYCEGVEPGVATTGIRPAGRRMPAGSAPPLPLMERVGVAAPPAPRPIKR